MAIASSSATAEIRAFGAAEGYGAVATGARASPSIYHVTNLNATGAGSFVDAISVANRIIVFDVGGVINLTSAPSAKSNLYIAGQTAPGGGISINGFQALGLANTSNNIVRHLRIRPGSSSPGSDNGIGMGRTGSCILDHLSIEFGKYNNIDAVSVTADAPRVTIQNSIIADPISNGTSNRGQGFGAHLEAVNGYFTLSNNLWANGHSRNPLAKVNEQFKNNIEYNNSTGYLTSGTSTAFDHDLVNNAFIFGPASTSSSDFGQLSTPDKFYATGNVQDTNSDGVWNPTNTNPTGGTTYASPRHASTTSLPTLSVADAYNYVMAQSGASLVRDSLDQLVIGQVQTLGLGTPGYTAGTTGPAVTNVPLDVENPFAGHTGLYHKSSDTGLPNNGLGAIATATRPAGFDVDNDGVADNWEAVHGMSSAIAADALAFNPLGYRMIEQYVNELGDTNETRTCVTSTNAPWSTGSNWTGGVAPGPYDKAVIHGDGDASSSVTVTGAANAMTLSIGGASAIFPGAGEAVYVNSGATLNIYDTLQIGDTNDGYLYAQGGTVSAYNIVLGNTAYQPAATNFAGKLYLSSGTVRFSSIVLGAGTPGNWNSGGSVQWLGGTLKPMASFLVNAPITLTNTNGTASFDTSGFDGTVTGIISSFGGFVKKGAGTLTLAGANTFTGPLTIQAGAVAVGTLNNAGTSGNLGAATADAANLILDGGTLKYTGSAGTATDRAFTLTAAGGALDSGSAGQMRFLGTSNVVASGTGNRTLTLTGTSTTNDFYLGLADPLSGKTSLTKTGAGRWILTAPATPRSYSGDTTVSAGTLMTNSDNPLPYGTGKGSLVIASGATFEMNGRNLNINGLNGAGTLNNRGNSTRTLFLGNGNAGGLFSGVISDNPLTTQGTLHLTKVGTGTQTLSGANTYDGDTTVDGGTLIVGTLATQPILGGTVITSPGGADVRSGTLVFDYSGSASPASTLVALLDAAYDVNFASGNIRSFTASASRGLGWIDDTVGGKFSVAATLYGDTNLDFTVNFDDLLVLAQSYGSAGATWATGDFNYDGAANFDDLLKLAQNYGSSVSFESDWALAQSLIPEPSTIGLLIAAIAGLRRMRTR